MKVSKTLAALALGSIVSLSFSVSADGVDHGFLSHLPTGEAAGNSHGAGLTNAQINRLYSGDVSTDASGNVTLKGSFFGAANLFTANNANLFKKCPANPTPLDGSVPAYCYGLQAEWVVMTLAPSP